MLYSICGSDYFNLKKTYVEQLFESTKIDISSNISEYYGIPLQQMMSDKKLQMMWLSVHIVESRLIIVSIVVGLIVFSDNRNHNQSAIEDSYLKLGSHVLLTGRDPGSFCQFINIRY